jgi:DedD protein
VNTLQHREGDDDLDELTGRRDREFTLGTTTILGIFFALAVLCGVFFGFGYSVGHKASVPPPVAAAPDTQNPSTFSGFKPAAGNPLNGAPDKPPVQTVTVPYSAPSNNSTIPRTAKPAPMTEAQADAAVVGDPPPPARPIATTSPASSTPIVAPAPGAPGALVQIAAVSHQEDADLLVTTLKRRGYPVVIHTEPQDKLLHVQIGPFASHKDADAMRQRLLNDGFNAIVKDTK